MKTLVFKVLQGMKCLVGMLSPKELAQILYRSKP